MINRRVVHLQLRTCRGGHGADQDGRDAQRGHDEGGSEAGDFGGGGRGGRQRPLVEVLQTQVPQTLQEEEEEEPWHSWCLGEVQTFTSFSTSGGRAPSESAWPLSRALLFPRLNHDHCHMTQPKVRELCV